jgi:hypothetical protein
MFTQSMPFRSYTFRSILHLGSSYLRDLIAFALSGFLAFELRFDGMLPAYYLRSMWMDWHEVHCVRPLRADARPMALYLGLRRGADCTREYSWIDSGRNRPRSLSGSVERSAIGVRC